MKFSQKIMLYFSIMLIIIIVISSIIIFRYTSEKIHKQITAQLQSISSLKENQLRFFVEQNVRASSEVAEDPLLITYLREYHSENQTSENDISDEREEEMEDVIAEMIEKERMYHSFLDFYIILPDGTIDMSSIPQIKGQIKSSEEYFQQGMKNVTIRLFYFDHSMNRPVSLIALPVKDSDQQYGVLVILLNDFYISRIMLENSGMEDSGETYIINSNNLMVTPSRYMRNAEYNKIITTPSANSCVKSMSGDNTHIGYRDIKVISVYKWVDEYNLCLLAEMDYAKAKEPAINLRNMMLWVVLIGILCTLLISYIMSKSITRPINDLLNQSTESAKGNFMKLKVRNSKDELSVLEESMNNAIDELKKTEELKKNFTQKLQEELDIKTKDLQEKIIETNNFRMALMNMMEDIGETNEHLKELDAAKTAFLNTSSHELKTPLTAINAYLDVLDDYKDSFNDEQKAGLDAIRRNSNQLKALITNILELSRIESGRFEINLSEIDIKKRIKSITDNLRVLAEQKNLKLEADIPDDMPKITTDDMRFEEILNNLLSNAIKFTETGKITVSATKSEKFISIKVADTGIGIPEDKLSKIFQNFYQVDSGLSRKYGGTGLGLSLTKKIIESLGGTITVQSIYGKGTTFHFNLPIHPNSKDKNIK